MLSSDSIWDLGSCAPVERTWLNFRLEVCSLPCEYTQCLPTWMTHATSEKVIPLSIVPTGFELFCLLREAQAQVLCGRRSCVVPEIGLQLSNSGKGDLGHRDPDRCGDSVEYKRCWTSDEHPDIVLPTLSFPPTEGSEFQLRIWCRQTSRLESAIHRLSIGYRIPTDKGDPNVGLVCLNDGVGWILEGLE